VKFVLSILFVGLMGCASIVSTDERFAASFANASDNRSASVSASAAAQTRTGQTTQRRGLPLTRGQKVLLWTGVAVFLGYLMADSDDDGEPSAFQVP